MSFLTQEASAVTCGRCRSKPGGVVLFQRRPDVETGLHVVVLVLHPKIIGIYYYFCCYVLFSSKGPFVGRVYKMSQPCAVDWMGIFGIMTQRGHTTVTLGKMFCGEVSGVSSVRHLKTNQSCLSFKSCLSQIESKASVNHCVNMSTEFHICLVAWNIFMFSIYWEKSSQLTNIFQRGRSTTNQIYFRCIQCPVAQRQHCFRPARGSR